MKILTSVIIAIFLLSACDNIINNDSKKTTIPIFSVEQLNYQDLSVKVRNSFINNSPRSFEAKHFCFRNIDGESIVAFLSQDFYSIYVINTSTSNSKVIPLPFKVNTPIESIYYHNLDSIFVFINREHKYDMKLKGVLISDFVLLNSLGEIINEYSLDDVPYIYNGSVDKMIFLKKDITKNYEVIKNQLYIPFSLYSPSIQSDELKNLEISLICKYDLLTKKSSMLNVKIPNNHIGSNFNENVNASSVDFRFFNENTFYYSFSYSPEIFKFDLKKNKITSVFVNCPGIFSNTDTSKYWTYFYAPIYSKKHSLFLRQLRVSGYKKYNDFMLTQVYDKDFNFLGIHLEDSIFTNITFNPEGDIVVSDKKNDYISYLVALKEPQIFEIMNIDSKLSKKELSLSTQPAKSESLPFDYRLYTYIQSLTEDYLEKVIFLNTDEMCFDCVDYILKHWNDNFGGSQKYRIVVFGTEKQFAIEMLTKYDIDIGNQVVIDTENTYLDLFKNVELQKVPMFHLTPTGPVLFPYSNLDLIKQFEKFVEN